MMTVPRLRLSLSIDFGNALGVISAHKQSPACNPKASRDWRGHKTAGAERQSPAKSPAIADRATTQLGEGGWRKNGSTSDFSYQRAGLLNPGIAPITRKKGSSTPLVA
jgi:hypothetical protein